MRAGSLAVLPVSVTPDWLRFPIYHTVQYMRPMERFLRQIDVLAARGEPLFYPLHAVDGLGLEEDGIDPRLKIHPGMDRKLKAKLELLRASLAAIAERFEPVTYEEYLTAHPARRLSHPDGVPPRGKNPRPAVVHETRSAASSTHFGGKSCPVAWRSSTPHDRRSGAGLAAGRAGPGRANAVPDPRRSTIYSQDSLRSCDAAAQTLDFGKDDTAFVRGLPTRIDVCPSVSRRAARAGFADWRSSGSPEGDRVVDQARGGAYGVSLRGDRRGRRRADQGPTAAGSRCVPTTAPPRRCRARRWIRSG
jgi:hypothetical protein